MHSVSLIVPSFNNGVYLHHCISSIRENSAGVNIEIIIVDDGSDDETSKQVINDLEVDKHLKVVRHEKNAGVQAARNTGLKAATGDFIVCMDGDDVLLPIPGSNSFLFEASQILSGNRNIAFVHTLVEMFGDFRGVTISSYPLREELVWRKHHVPISIVYRREEILKGLSYLEDVPKWQDWAYGISLLAGRWKRGEASEVGFVRGPGYGYRVHSTTPRISRGQASEYDATKRVVQVYPDYFASKLPDTPHDIDSLTAAVVASKPTALEDLLHVASADLDLALSMARGREYQIRSVHVDRLGIP